MYEHISNDDIMMADSFGFFLGIPKSKAVCTGLIDGTNKVFNVPDAPIYPKSGMGILPEIRDIVAYERKTTAGTPPTNVDTILAASKIDTIIDPSSGDEIDGAFELATAPLATSADAIVCDYVEELQPFVAQDITPTLKQTKKDVGRIYSNDTMTGYGNIAISIKSEQVMAKQTVKYINKLLFGPYKGTATKAVGCTAYDLLKKPIDLYGYMTMDWEDDVLGRIYFEQVRVTPDIPNAKAEGTGGFTLDMTVAKMPRLVLPDAV